MGSDGGPRLEVDSLSAWYGERKAIENISLTVAPHRVTAIIGPSGCGKSTVLRCMNRMHEVVRGARAEGKVSLNGENVYAPEVDPVRVRLFRAFVAKVREAYAGSDQENERRLSDRRRLGTRKVQCRRGQRLCARGCAANDEKRCSCQC